MLKTSRALLLIGAFATIYIGWGTTYLANHFLLRELPPFVIGCLRFALAGGLALLWVALSGQLRLQRSARPVAVEVAEERILRFFENERGVEPRREPLRECRFACADRTFDRDVAELQGAPMISSRREAFDAAGRDRAVRFRVRERTDRAACRACAPKQL